MDLMRGLCSDLIDDEMFRNMQFNGEGDGPPDDKTCAELANRLERWLNSTGQEPHVWEVPPFMRVSAATGKFLSEDEMADPEAVAQSTSPYRVSPEIVREFVDFLRHCGGFMVW